MNINSKTGHISATKNETSRFTEAAALAYLARRIEGDGPNAAFWEELESLNKRAAKLIGPQHLDPETGWLRETAAEARVSSSVPE